MKTYTDEFIRIECAKLDNRCPHLRISTLPNYPNDHNATILLIEKHKDKRLWILSYILKQTNPVEDVFEEIMTIDKGWFILTATSRQLCLALLKAKGVIK